MLQASFLIDLEIENAKSLLERAIGIFEGLTREIALVDEDDADD
jgi:hypothetical protein